MQFLIVVIFCFIALICLIDGQTSVPSRAPTAKPTSRAPTIAPSGPSRKPTRKPTRSPTFRAKANSIYTDFAPTETLTSEEQQGIVGTLTVLLFVLMATEITSPEVLFLIALIIVILTEILTLSQGLAGFSNNALITIGTLFLVVGAVEKSHVVDWMARKTFGVTGSTFIGKLRMYVTCFFLSIFFNNTPLVAILMPVVKDWGRMRGIGASQLLMPLSYAVLAGSYGSMIGTSTNLTVQGLMQADRGYSFSFFAPLPIGIVCFAALLVYMLIFGPLMLPMNRSGLIREARDYAKQLIAEVLVSDYSPAVGRNVEFFAASLGVAPSSIIKIRRVAGSEVQKDIEGGSSKNRFSKILDYDYLKKAVRFWEGENKETIDEINEPHEHVEYIDIIAPPPHELVGANDVIFLSSAQDAVEKMMKSILGESKGLKILKSDVLALPGFGTEVVECVVSDNNPFLGKKVSEMAKEFSERYQAALITVRGREWGDFLGEEEEENKDKERSSDEADNAPRNATGHQPLKTDDTVEEGKNNNQVISQSEIELTPVSGDESNKVTAIGSSEDVGLISEKKVLEVPTVSEHILTLGDVILCVTNEKNLSALSRNRDFFVVSSVGSLPKPLTFYTLIPVACFVTMLILVACETIDICPAALALTAFFFMGGWIVPEDIPVMVDIRLLMLLGTSLSFATSMTTSGLATTIAKSISASDPTNFAALLLVYAITLVITELISNNAAAALMYPIGVGLADELGVSFKPFAMAVLVSSTAGFMSPIGYQTHVMVWGPGGYRFKDFMLFGILPDIIYWFLGCALTVALFPFDEVSN
eukprot:gene1712-1819_t